MAKVTKAEVYFRIAVAGFLMPIFQLVDTTKTYALTQIANGTSKALATATPSVIPPTAPLVTSLAIVVFVLGIVYVVQDFEKGMKMKYKTLVFIIGELFGLHFFWTALSNITPMSLSNGAIFSSVLSIVVMFISMCLAIYLES